MNVSNTKNDRFGFSFFLGHFQNKMVVFQKSENDPSLHEINDKLYMKYAASQLYAISGLRKWGHLTVPSR